METINDAAKNALTINMGLKPDESCLIITDAGKRRIGEAFYEEANKITDNTKLIEIPELKVNGEEPSKEVAEMMKHYDVIMIPTTKSLSHTKARRDAVDAGARIASMPGITEDMATRCLGADYEKIKARTRRLIELHDKGSNMRITTTRGTDITMSIEGLHCRGAAAGILTKPGSFGNLPEGESNMAPVEGSANGIFIVDKTMAGVGKLISPIRITVKDGMAVKIEGKEEAEKLKDMLEAMNDPKVYNIAEIGIGTNDKATITGNTLEDEKVLGTCHIALGNNMSYEGGTCNAPIHLDGVIDKPTIYIDDKKIMKDGKLLA
jgi:leucyl aminopeptidase (aminopeptidase T)